MSDPVTSRDPISSRDRDRGRGGDWSVVPLGGLAIVAVGLIFLARNFGLNLPLPDRWWAIFILLPATGALVTAVRFFRMDGRFSSRVAGAATVGTLILATALILFLDLDWGKTWPVMVIIVGLGVIARGTRRRD